jgi:fermentation-respiration switch protein FrsA (DUF1100 family)
VLPFVENWFLFRPARAADCWWPPPAGLAVRDVELTSADGTRLHAWWAEPEGWRPERGAVLYCHGNGGNLSGRGDSVRDWRDALGLAVLIFDYPGYGKSAGRPTEAGCYAAAEAAHAWLVGEQKVRPEDVVLHGGSLGGAIAAELAARRPFRMLVLVKTFTSFADMAQKTFPWLPLRWVVCARLDTLGKIGTLRGPVFVAHGTADRVVPFAQGERLFAAAREPKRFLRLEGQGHNEPPPAEFYEAVQAFLAETAGEGAR